MSSTLTIRNLDDEVKRKLRLCAASHQRSMEAEAREILASVLSGSFAPPRSPEGMRERLKAVSGIWKDCLGGKTTDEIMKELRGDA